ncbi:hypothetical protein OESDEN_22946, partial [Oesophagostomum dentatum]
LFQLIYPLPDGSRLEIGASRFRAPEVLFRPELIGEEWPGIAQLVNDSIRKCDMDVRKTLYGSIILSGGSTLFQGFGDRLLSEVSFLQVEEKLDMRRLSPQDTKVRITAPQVCCMLFFLSSYSFDSRLCLCFHADYE